MPDEEVRGRKGRGGTEVEKLPSLKPGEGEGGRRAIRLLRPLSSPLLLDLGRTFFPQLFREIVAFLRAEGRAALGNQSERDAGEIAVKRVISGRPKISNEALPFWIYFSFAGLELPHIKKQHQNAQNSVEMHLSLSVVMDIGEKGLFVHTI